MNMNVRVFNAYQRICKETLHEPISCLNKDHPPLYPHITTGMHHEDTIISLKCAGCDYKMYPGLTMYEHYKKIVETYYDQEFKDYSL